MRRFLALFAVLGTTTALVCGSSSAQNSAKTSKGRTETPKTFRVWVFADAHVGSDKKHGRESLAEAHPTIRVRNRFRLGHRPGFGRYVGRAGYAEGPGRARRSSGNSACYRSTAVSTSTILSGNHDRSGLDEPQAWWWRKWIDPTGEHTEFSHVDATKRPFPIEGTWERYSFRVGNLLFLMMSDINEPTQKVGRGTLGGNPGGVVSGETFRWWKRMVEENPIVRHHQRASLRAQKHHGRIGRVGGHAARRKRRRGNLGTMAIFLKARRRVRHSCTGWIANRIPARSRMFWRQRPRVSIYGSERTLTRFPTTPTAGNHTSSSDGARRSSMRLP